MAANYFRFDSAFTQGLIRFRSFSLPYASTEAILNSQPVQVVFKLIQIVRPSIADRAEFTSKYDRRFLVDQGDATLAVMASAASGSTTASIKRTMAQQESSSEVGTSRSRDIDPNDATGKASDVSTDAESGTELNADATIDHRIAPLHAAASSGDLKCI